MLLIERRWVTSKPARARSRPRFETSWIICDGGQAIGIVDRFAEGVRALHADTVAEGAFHVDVEGVVDGVGAGGDEVHGGEVGIESVEDAAIERVAAKAVHVGFVIKMVAGRAVVIRFEHDPGGDIALNAEEPVVGVRLFQVGVRDEHGNAEAVDAAGRVQAYLQRWVDGKAQIRFRWISEGIRERSSELRADSNSGAEGRIVSKIEDGSHEQAVIGDPVAASELMFCRGHRDPRRSPRVA